MRTFIISSVVVLGSVFAAEASASTTCTVRGSYRVEPLDTWYCDTDHVTSCAGWNEVDLDQKRGANAAPLQHMRMVLRDSAGNQLDQTATGTDGSYSMSFVTLAASCAGQVVQVQNYFQRIHGDDHEAASPRSRFQIVNSNNVTYHGLLNVPLTGAVTAQSRTYLATEDAINARMANVYYTINSLVTEVVSWSGRLNSLFTGGGSTGQSVFQIKYWTANTSLLWGTRALMVPYDGFADGAAMRHEISHSLHNAIHGGEQLMSNKNVSCMSYNHGGAEKHNRLSCEWGFTAMKEGLATFLAIRSLTAADTQVFTCTCDADPSNGDAQDVCSKRAVALVGASPDADRISEACTDGSVAGIGDVYSNSNATCARVSQDRGCDCTDSPCEDEFRTSQGWQNETQVERFLWDMIDASTDGGQDDTNESINSFVAMLEAMPCDSGTLNVDGTCNEPNRMSGGSLACTPNDDTSVLDPPHGGTRHSYNVWDFAEMIPGDQVEERILNCVQGATD